MIEWHHLDKRKFFVLGPCIFVFVRGLVYPFNLVKTRLFMQEKKSIYTGSLDAIRKIVKYEGVRGLYRGYFASLLGLISGQLYISSYEMVRGQLHGYSTEVKGLVGGACATLIGQTITVPVDIVTQHRMMQGQVRQWTKGGGAKKSKAVSSLAIIQKILNHEGPRGLYKGYTVSLVTYAPGSAMWWSFYSGFYRIGVEHGLLEVSPMPLVQAGSGVMAGLLTSILTNPLDVLRTRYQVIMKRGRGRERSKDESVKFMIKNFVML